MKFSIRFLVIFVFFVVLSRFVYAIPSSSIIPFIGPIIAQIALLASGAFFFMMAKFSKYKILFLVLGVIILASVIFIWLW